MTKWLFVATAENWQKCLEDRTWGANDRYKSAMQRVKIGDEILVHLTENRTAGICKVVREYFEDNSKIWESDDVYRHRIGIEPLKLPPFPIDAKYSYDKYLQAEHGNPRGYFGNAIREIPDNEFSIFESDIDRSINEQNTKLQEVQVKEGVTDSIEQCLSSFPDENDRNVIENKRNIHKQFLEYFPFKEHPEYIDNLAPDDIFRKERDASNNSFLYWIAFKAKPLGGIGIRSLDFGENAREYPDKFKQLLKVIFDPTKSLAQKVDAEWDEISGFGRDKIIAKKIIYMFEPENTLPIDTKDLEMFLHKLKSNYSKEAITKFGKGYEQLTVGQQYEFLMESLMKFKTEINKNWDSYTFHEFLYKCLKSESNDYLSIQPFIYLTGYDENNLTISKQSNILGWKERPSRLSFGDYVFVYNTTTDKIETCFQIKSLSNKTMPIWYEEIHSDPQTLLYKNRWDADIICDGLDIGLNVIFNIEPFKNDKKTFSLLVRNKVPRSLEDVRYKEFRTFLLDKCGIKFEQKNYLLLLTQPNTEWDDKEGRVYHYGNNVSNYLQVIPGSKAIFYLLEHGNIRPIGSAQIHSINKEGRNRITPKGRAIIENIAQLQDYEKLDIADGVRFEFEQRVKSLPNYNNQHSIIPITKEVYDLVISAKKEEERATYTLNELTKNTFIKQSEFEEWEDILKEKGQVIFYGPPGTGKTFVATEFSKYLTYKNGGTYELVQFHPSYSYEDFVEGIKPQIRNGMLEYIAKDAIFKKFCKRATLNNLQKYILIIDEINRGNLSKIFGELIYSLEYRGEERRSRKEITLPYTNEHFTIPENVWIIGTMNSADRSIALVDYALRRRFYFVELMPDARILDAFFTVTHPRINKDKVIQFFNQINETITKDEKLGRHFQLGHSYFMRTNMDEKMLKRIWRYAVKPVLEEYYFEEQEQIDRFEQLLEQAIKMG